MTGLLLRRGAMCAAVLGLVLAAVASPKEKISHSPSSSKSAAVRSNSSSNRTSPVLGRVQGPLSIPTASGFIGTKAIEIEEDAQNDTVKIGTNLYPVDLSQIDSVFNLPQFAIDPLYSLLNFAGTALSNTPLLNTDAPAYVDWVKDTLPNLDAPSIVDGIATGIVTTGSPTSGVAYDGVKRGHWNGARIVDGLAGADKNIFLKGGKEEDLSTWDIGPGTVGSSKYDMTQAYIANGGYPTSDTTNFPTGRKNVLYFAMERRGNNGTTAFDFEFNQHAPLNDYVPVRTDGDVLFTFEMTGSGGSGSAKVHVYVWGDDNYLNNEILSTSLPLARRPVASINQKPTPSAPWGYVNDKGVWVIGQIPNYSVAEAAVPFGVDFLTNVNSCGGSAYVQVRTRSSVTNTSDLKDTTKYFRYSFGGPTVDLRLASNCGQTFDYSGTGSTDSNGGTNLTYDWTFTPPAGVTLSSGNSEFGVDPNNSSQYIATFTSDSARNVTVNLPVGVDYADIGVKLKVTEASACSQETTVHTVRVWRALDALTTMSAPCSSTFAINYGVTATGGNAPLSYSWKFYKKGTPDVEVGTSSTANGTFNAPSAGTYYGIVTVKDTADTSSNSKVTPKPQCSVLKTSVEVTTYDALSATATLTGACDARTLTYSSTASGGDNTFTYAWKFYKMLGASPDPTTDTQIGTAADASGTVSPTPAEDGTYYGVMTITDGTGNACTKTVTSGTVAVYGPMNPEASKTSADGSALSVKLTVTYHAPATVQWQRFDGTDWVNIAGATGDTLTYSSFEADATPTPVSFSIGTDSYVGKLYTVLIRAITSRTINGGCQATSNQVTVKKVIAVDP